MLGLSQEAAGRSNLQSGLTIAGGAIGLISLFVGGDGLNEQVQHSIDQVLHFFIETALLLKQIKLKIIITRLFATRRSLVVRLIMIYFIVLSFQGRGAAPVKVLD